MKKLSKILCAILAFCMVLPLTACGGGASKSSPKPSYLSNGYTYRKQNTDGLMQFYSSDETLDAFVNEYMRRHLRYDDEAIGALKIGDGNTVWKEWEIMSVAWMNTAGIGYTPKDSVANWFSSIYQDEFGYIWVTNPGPSTANWGQGWEFPSYGHTYDSESSYYLNTSYFNGVNNLRGINGSNELSEMWTGVSDNGINGSLEKSTTDYWDSMLVKGNDMKSVTFTYNNRHVELDENETATNDKPNGDGAYVLKPFMATAWCSPFLELKFSLTDYDSLGTTDQVEDIYVYWKGGSGVKNTEWDTDHMVKYSEWCINKNEQFSSFTDIILPMYAHQNWGKSKSFDDAITDMKIEVIFKNGINAEVRLEEVTMRLDSRQILNNCVFLTAAAYYFQYTQDTAWLQANMDKIRKAFQFLLTYCHGADQALITTEELVGHDGSSNYEYYGKDAYDMNAVGSGIGDGYWDSINCPQVSLYANLYYYKAVSGIEYLEKMFAAAELTESGKAVTVRNAGLTSTVNYAETLATLATKKENLVRDFREYFWNEATGRFLLGYLPDTDPGVVAEALGAVESGKLYGKTEEGRVKVDYGFTTFNEEAIELGLATAEQAESIMQWINGERKVAGDNADNSTKAKQIYQYSFAPRWTTKENVYQFWYRFDGKRSGKYGWDKQVQNGGTALHCAYYDLVAEQLTNGSDAAFTKLKNLQAWYEKVQKKGGEGDKFYRMYYDDMGVNLQGNGAGVIGLDCEFIEAAVVVTAIPTSFFGLSSTEYGVLDIVPALPESLKYWKMENVYYGGVNYDLSMGNDWIQINSIEGNPENLKVRVTLPLPSYENYSVRQHNRVLTEGEDYVVSGDKLVVTAPFVNGRIQIIDNSKLK